VVDKLVDLRWHGVALADVAHGVSFRPGEKMSAAVAAGDRQAVYGIIPRGAGLAQVQQT
jgi:hypothetical protein